MTTDLTKVSTSELGREAERRGYHLVRRGIDWYELTRAAGERLKICFLSPEGMIKFLYRDFGYTLEEIGRFLGVTGMTVRHRMISFGIERRKPGERKVFKVWARVEEGVYAPVGTRGVLSLPL
jgi:hypothetical protein